MAKPLDMSGICTQLLIDDAEATGEPITAEDLQRFGSPNSSPWPISGDQLARHVQRPAETPRRVMVAGSSAPAVVVVEAAIAGEHVSASPVKAYRHEPRVRVLDVAFRLIDRRAMDHVHESRRSRRA